MISVMVFMISVMVYKVIEVVTGLLCFILLINEISGIVGIHLALFGLTEPGFAGDIGTIGF